MISVARSYISSYITNYQSWRTNRRIVVFESDDWGSIRMPSRTVYEKALDYGYPVHLNRYDKFDSLLSETDLIRLFEVLDFFRDINGSSPIITANCVVANPNFEEIEKSSFEEYHYELVTDTFLRYPNHARSWELWKSGIEKRLIFPQYHAREHLNVSLFMRDLRNRDPDAIWAFNHRCIGMPKISNGIFPTNPYVESTRFASDHDLEEKMNIYLAGLELFEGLFQFKSETVIPTNYLWNSFYDQKLLERGVIGLQGVRFLTNPLNPIEINRRYTRRRMNTRFVDLVRNNRFEPSLSNNKRQELNNCLEKMRFNFMLNCPNIISIHRLNFSGEIFEENRSENLFFYIHF